MRPTYLATFNLGRASSTPPAFADVLAECRRWVSSPRSGVDPISVSAIDYASSAHTPLGPSASLDLLRHDGEGLSLLGLRLEHPDHEMDDARWRTEVCVVDDREAGCVRTTVATSIGRAGTVSPLPAAPSRPRLVRDLVGRFGAYDRHPIQLEPWTVKPGDVRALVDLLFDPSRTLPVVFVSARNWDDRPIAEGRQIADRLVALAHVAVAGSRWPSFEIRDALGRELTCWDGAVRVYWPGLRRDSDPFEHPLYMPSHVQETERRGGLAVELLARLSRSAINRAIGGLDTWEGIERHIAHERSQALKARADKTELLDLYAEDNADLTKQVTDLRAQLAATKESLVAAERREESWKSAYLEVQRMQGAQGQDPAAPVEAPPVNVSDALARVMREHPGRLVNRLNSKSTLDGSPYEDVDGFYQACLFLATVYFDAKTGKAPCSDLDLACRTASGFTYSSSQSATTMGKYANYYEIEWGGRVVQLEEHVGKGSDKDARYAIRVAFFWDRQKKVVVLGYIGQHQRTGAT